MKFKLTTLGPCSTRGAAVYAESPAEALEREMFARTGGRLPPPLSEVRHKYQQGPCSEACCRRRPGP